MGHTTHLRKLVDDEWRQKMTDALTPVAALLLERDIWRTHWGVEIDGCVFKIKVEGYPKRGTPRYEARERELAEAMREFEAEHLEQRPSTEGSSGSVDGNSPQMKATGASK